MKRVLVVKGVREIDELKSFGMIMAERFKASDHVWFVDAAGHGREVKGSIDQDGTGLELFDADPLGPVVAAAMRRIMTAYEEQHEATSHLAHSFVGKWLFYFPARPEGWPTVIEAIFNGDAKLVESSADLFIACDFGAKTPAMLVTDDQAPSAHAETAPVPGDAGERADVRPDRG